LIAKAFYRKVLSAHQSTFTSVRQPPMKRGNGGKVFSEKIQPQQISDPSR